jgi:hypothetical protein
MVGAINARKGMFTAFQANAKSLAVVRLAIFCARDPSTSS